MYKTCLPPVPLLLILVTLGCLLFGLHVSKVQAETIIRTEKLAANVYALIGPLSNRDPVNLGNNANFGVVVTDEGVVLIDSGATNKGAEMIHSAIKNITNQPIKIVINSGGQDHRWLGNGYFKAQGARIIASEKAVIDQKARTQDQLFRLAHLVGVDGVEGTAPVYADETFSESMNFKLGQTRFEIKHRGHAHTPGDSFIWLPQDKIVFAGDIVYTDRLLRIGGQSAHRSWITAFESMASLKPETVVGGHGSPASLKQATEDTYDYLVFIRKSIQQFMDDGNGIEDVGSIDQSSFSYLENFNSLKGRNAQRVYDELEWE